LEFTSIGNLFNSDLFPLEVTAVRASTVDRNGIAAELLCNWGDDLSAKDSAKPTAAFMCFGRGCLDPRCLFSCRLIKWMNNFNTLTVLESSGEVT
jgi:hypothetical protein